MSNLNHGTKYEIYIKNFIKNNYINTWLWSEIPIEILYKLKIITSDKKSCDDIGCDILAETHDNKYHFIQCKNYSTIGIENTINICGLAGFYNFMAENEFTNGIVYYSGILSSQVKLRAKSIKYIHLPYSTCQNIIITPHSYQIEAYNKLACQGRNILTMPCGTGKTYVSYMLSLNYQNVILISPLISTSEQLYVYYKKYYSNQPNVNICLYNCMSSNKNIDSTQKNIIISTYNSVSLFADCINSLPNRLIIIDEYHNLSFANITNTNDAIYRLLNINMNYLFISATPHKLRNSYNNIFGQNEYILTWDKAIKNKYICDYKFYYPSADIIDTKIQELRKTTILSSIEITKSILINKAYYLLECIKSSATNKIIIFLKTVNEATQFSEIIKVLNIYFNFKLQISVICYDTTKTNRNKYITRFRNGNDKIQILCNVHVLDEGIDIPECDAVYLTNPNNNPINIIQRISRCNRLNRTTNKETAHIFIWAKDDNKVKNIDKLIGEYLLVNHCVFADNKYIKNLNKSVVLPNVYSESAHNTNLTINKINNELLFIKMRSAGIPNEFIKDILNHYLSFKTTDFVIDLNIGCEWLELRKDSIKRTIIESYKENIDFKIVKSIDNHICAGRPKEIVLLTPDCFKKLCFLSKSNNSHNIRDYFNIFDNTILHIAKHINSQTKLPREFEQLFSSEPINNFIIDLSKLAKMLLCNKGNIKKTLVKSYIINVDYVINTTTLGVGRPFETILLTIDCFKHICATSKTSNSDLIRNILLAV